MIRCQQHSGRCNSQVCWSYKTAGRWIDGRHFRWGNIAALCGKWMDRWILVPRLKKHDWLGIVRLFRYKPEGKIRSVDIPKWEFWATKKARCSVVSVNSEEGGDSVFSFVNAIHIFCLKWWRGNEDWEVAFLHYLEVIGPSKHVEEKQGSTCLRLSTIEDWVTLLGPVAGRWNYVCWRTEWHIKHIVSNVDGHPETYHPSVDHSSRRLQRSHPRIYVNQFYVWGRGENDQLERLLKVVSKSLRKGKESTCCSRKIELMRVAPSVIMMYCKYFAILQLDL